MPENYNFTYKVKTVNIENASIEVDYIPEDISLVPVKIFTNIIKRPINEIVDENNNPIYKSEDEIPIKIHLDYTTEKSAPILRWRNQKVLLDNIDKLENKTGRFEIDLNKGTANNSLGMITNL